MVYSYGASDNYKAEADPGGHEGMDIHSFFLVILVLTSLFFIQYYEIILLYALNACEKIKNQRAS